MKKIVMLIMLMVGGHAMADQDVYNVEGKQLNAYSQASTSEKSAPKCDNVKAQYGSFAKFCTKTWYSGARACMQEDGSERVCADEHAPRR